MSSSVVFPNSTQSFLLSICFSLNISYKPWKSEEKIDFQITNIRCIFEHGKHIGKVSHHIIRETNFRICQRTLLRSSKAHYCCDIFESPTLWQYDT